MNIKNKKIIIDSDLGDDIDDAYAIYYALSEPKLDVIGITTVYENAYLRARLAKKIVTLLKKDIPVYAGYKKPLRGLNLRDIDRLFCQYEEDLMNYMPDNKNTDFEDEAIDYILDQAKKYGKELIIVAIGPLTNIAKAILKDKETMKSIDKIVCMAGSFYDEQVEWNITCDIDAAKIVLESGIHIQAFGLDVTDNLRVEGDALNKLLQKEESEALGYLYDLTRLWYKDYQRPIILYDVLPFNYLLTGENVNLHRHGIYVDDKGEIKLGLTINLDNEAYKHLSNGNYIESGKTVSIDNFFKDINESIIKIK